MNSKRSKSTSEIPASNILTIVKWIAIGDIFFGIAVIFTAHYVLASQITQWFGLAVTLIGGLLFMTMRILEKRQQRIINSRDQS